MRNEKQIKQVILHRFFRKMLGAGSVCMGLLVLLLFLGKTICDAYIWYGTEGFYPMLHWISENQGIFVCVMFLAGLLIIGIVYWIKLLNYFQEVLGAMEHLTEESGPIQLRGELREVEQYMNQVQRQNQKNRELAREAEQRKNDLIVYLAHDLKTPLTSVIGYLTLLREEREISPELQEKYLSVSLEKAERLETLINEFFEITRFNLTHLELETSTISLKLLLEQTVFEFHPIFQEKNLTCRLTVEPEDLKITCDSEKLQRVFDNLLRNAVLYSYEDTEIRLRAESSEDRVYIQVENRGATIPEEKLERVFEQFYRLDSARQSKGGGAGLGLAIAREIVRLHKGSIKAESQQERTVFTVELPLAAASG
ncbi:HAMP domain-containing sensor histidine kinase [Lachnospiraceae bacterium KK002]